jgi:shikimate kinase
VKAVVVRGPHANGRATIVRAVARAMGRGVLEIRGPVRADEERWLQLGTLATLLRAMPVVRIEQNPGDGSEIPRLRGYDGPVAVIAGKHGALYGDGVDGALTLSVPMPGPAEREVLWQRALGDGADGTAAILAERFRLTSGSLRRAAAGARTAALVAGRPTVTPADVRAACRPLHREIERLAAFVPSSGGWQSIAACGETIEELRSLELRCRHREGLHGHVGPLLETQVTTGVRALFAGPSGTGKTMAARLLAASLEMDLYRLDLASVVNKYIGETEKNLDQLFSRAEELDVILLIDEGDALLTGRTAVQTSNDRYANLETNFLLQRLESYEGILIVTTNAASRIDSAFQRRMDVVVEFRMPSPHERWLAWQLHLPLDHAVAHEWLQEAAVRCAISGGQIRNAVLHASLVALEEQRRLGTADLERALEREYRKSGSVCPLPPTAIAV